MNGLELQGIDYSETPIGVDKETFKFYCPLCMFYYKGISCTCKMAMQGAVLGALTSLVDAVHRYIRHCMLQELHLLHLCDRIHQGQSRCFTDWRSASVYATAAAIGPHVRVSCGCTPFILNPFCIIGRGEDDDLDYNIPAELPGMSCPHCGSAHVELGRVSRDSPLRYQILSFSPPVARSPSYSCAWEQ